MVCCCQSRTIPFHLRHLRKHHNTRNLSNIWAYWRNLTKKTNSSILPRSGAIELWPVLHTLADQQQHVRKSLGQDDRITHLSMENTLGIKTDRQKNRKNFKLLNAPKNSSDSLTQTAKFWIVLIGTFLHKYAGCSSEKEFQHQDEISY